MKFWKILFTDQEQKGLTFWCIGLGVLDRAKTSRLRSDQIWKPAGSYVGFADGPPNTDDGLGLTESYLTSLPWKRGPNPDEKVKEPFFGCCGCMVETPKYPGYSWHFEYVDLTGEALVEFDRRYKWTLIKNGQEELLTNAFFQGIAKAIRAEQMGAIEDVARQVIKARP